MATIAAKPLLPNHYCQKIGTYQKSQHPFLSTSPYFSSAKVKPAKFKPAKFKPAKFKIGGKRIQYPRILLK
ncbi:hypothetical protein B8W92_03190 [Moraxella osloensis]|nr:hypothetical protein B8W92_03190 [Moraxella osloensis]